jgi:hypothetical protein
MSGRAIHVGDSGEPRYVLKAEMRDLRRRVGVLEEQVRALAQVAVLLAQEVERCPTSPDLAEGGSAHETRRAVRLAHEFAARLGVSPAAREEG